ncbi:hypothetical protein Tco_0066916 [Tanacetum coccineum]
MKLYALRMTESTLVTEHVNNMNTLFSQLTSLSCKIEPQEHAENLLQSLHGSYDQLIIKLTSNILSDYLVFDDVTIVVLEEENRHNNKEDIQASSRQVEALMLTRGKSMKPGSNGSHNHEDGKAVCCEAAVANEARKRFADVCFNDYELKIIGIGSIMVKMHDSTVRTIRDVRNVEGLKNNILSLEMLDDLGCKVEIQNKIMKIIKGTFVLMRGENVAANVYQLKGEIKGEAEASILVERKLLPSLTNVSLPFGEHCGINKQHHLKFKTLNSRSVSVLELVHSDMWQASVQPLGGAKFSKFTKREFELDSGKKTKCLRTNNQGEYTRDELILFAGKVESKGSSLHHMLLNRIEYTDEVKGYRVWDPTAHKVVVNRDFVFLKDKIQENKEGDNTTRETTSIDMEKEFQSNDSFEVAPQHEMNEKNKSQAPATRTLNSERKRPKWHSDYVVENNFTFCLLTNEGRSSTLQEALDNPDASFRRQ